MFAYFYDLLETTGHLVAAGRPNCDEAYAMVETVATHPDLPTTRNLLIDVRQYTAIPRHDVLRPMASILKERILAILCDRRAAIVTIAGSQYGAAAFMLKQFGLKSGSTIIVVHTLREAQHHLGLASVVLLLVLVKFVYHCVSFEISQII